MGSSSNGPPGEGALRPVPEKDERGRGERPLRVYLVEDVVAFRDRLADYLAEPGEVEMVGFADTEDLAVRYLRSEDPDVVIVDLHLKSGNGIGVIAAARALKPQPPPTIVVLTNYAFPEFELACRARGANYFFDKSTQFGAVKALLRDLRRAA
jgi:DNA-binding NarL/FixJ family response regulator